VLLLILNVLKKFSEERAANVFEALLSVLRIFVTSFASGTGKGIGSIARQGQKRGK